jgi:integrase
VDIAQYYAQHKLRDLPNKTVSEVLAEMLKAKRDEGLSDLYLRDLKIRGGKFAKDFQCNLASVQMDKIRDWLQAMPVANRSRNNCRLAVQTLFAFAKSRKYLPADWQEFKSIPLWKIKSEPVEIFTPEELEKLLSLANDNLIPFLTIGAFAGLRSAEIERLDWVKINLESDFITVDASIAKTNSRRLIPIQPNLKAWLKPHAKPQGKVVDLVGISSAIYRLIDNTRPNDPDNPKSKLKPSVEWRRNALRHSYCSYRLAQIKNTAEVALEAGNSPQMIFQHSMILLTDHAQPHCFSVDLILRNLPPQDSFVVEWKYPVMVERDDLEPEGEEDAREDERTRQILGLLQDEPMTTGKWEEEAIAAGIPHATFFRIKTKLQDGGHIIRDRSDRTWSLPAKPAKPK